MTTPLFLFCGGPAIYGDGVPKPLMKVSADRSLLLHFLSHLVERKAPLPLSITLLCDDGQKAAFENELQKFVCPVPICVEECSASASTFEKFEHALEKVKDQRSWIQFGYPDIFFFGENAQPEFEVDTSNACVQISAVPLTSRFPRLFVDIYNNEIKGISNHSAPVPANPMHVFGGDLWGRCADLTALVKEFKATAKIEQPSLEYDFFFWLINQKKMRCVLLFGERLWVDSNRDIQKLLLRKAELT